MKENRFTIKTICFFAEAGLLCTSSALTGLLYFLTDSGPVLAAGALLTALSLFWLLLFIYLFEQRLSGFSAKLCRTLDGMMNGGEEPAPCEDTETLFARISLRLSRLYDALCESRLQAQHDREALQELVTDISHQVRLPLSNLKTAAETLSTRPLAENERTGFLQVIIQQTEKLDFLLQAMVKTSRLETGILRLEKKDARLQDTLAQALSGIVYPAQRKDHMVDVSCPEELRLIHDAKWTAEALFNLLDNAVKYTPAGGSIRVTATLWEMYVKIDVEDTGKGIAESSQASVFRRFYRESEVHEQPGAGVGLYLAREIITRQGGYIKLSSQKGHGSVFSVFLPRL